MTDNYEQLGDLPVARQILLNARIGLQERGTLTCVSGVDDIGHRKVSLHSCIGPEDYPGGVNEDYVALWCCGSDTHRFAIALADGVGDSRCSELAAELACIVALAELASCPSEQTPDSSLICQQITKHLDEIVAAAEALPDWTPSQITPSLWADILRARELLQTTLTLFWADDSHFQLAAIGDGPIIAKATDGSVHVIRASTPTSQTTCLGPERPIAPFDAEYQDTLAQYDIIALMSDGLDHLGAGHEEDFLSVIARQANRCHSDNIAKAILEHAIVTDDNEDLEDNMTLAIIRS